MSDKLCKVCPEPAKWFFATTDGAYPSCTGHLNQIKRLLTTQEFALRPMTERPYVNNHFEALQYMRCSSVLETLQKMESMVGQEYTIIAERLKMWMMEMNGNTRNRLIGVKNYRFRNMCIDKKNREIRKRYENWKSMSFALRTYTRDLRGYLDSLATEIRQYQHLQCPKISHHSEVFLSYRHMFSKLVPLFIDSETVLSLDPHSQLFAFHPLFLQRTIPDTFNQLEAFLCLLEDVESLQSLISSGMENSYPVKTACFQAYRLLRQRQESLDCLLSFLYMESADRSTKIEAKVMCSSKLSQLAFLSDSSEQSSEVMLPDDVFRLYTQIEEYVSAGNLPEAVSMLAIITENCKNSLIRAGTYLSQACLFLRLDDISNARDSLTEAGNLLSQHPESSSSSGDLFFDEILCSHTLVSYTFHVLKGFLALFAGRSQDAVPHFVSAVEQVTGTFWHILTMKQCRRYHALCGGQAVSKDLLQIDLLTVPVICQSSNAHHLFEFCDMNIYAERQPRIQEDKLHLAIMEHRRLPDVDAYLNISGLDSVSWAQKLRTETVQTYKVAPAYPQYLLFSYLSKFLIVAQAFEEAETTLIHILREFQHLPTEQEILVNRLHLAVVYIERSDCHQAQMQLDQGAKALVIANDFVKACFKEVQANIHMENERFIQAENELNQALLLIQEPHFHRGYLQLQLGQVYMKTNRPEEAERTLMDVLLLARGKSPELEAHTLETLALCIKSNRDQEASKHLDSALVIADRLSADESARVWIAHGGLSCFMGNNIEAKRYFDTAEGLLRSCPYEKYSIKLYLGRATLLAIDGALADAREASKAALLLCRKKTNLCHSNIVLAYVFMACCRSSDNDYSNAKFNMTTAFKALYSMTEDLTAQNAFREAKLRWDLLHCADLAVQCCDDAFEELTVNSEDVEQLLILDRRRTLFTSLFRDE